ncbi:MAG UNVERIFIED_CONTAM: hypothetical protein LVR29_21025 [Microcystis novacekii LVE1205-3]
MAVLPGSLLGLVGFRYFQQNSSLNLDQWLPPIIGLVLINRIDCPSGGTKLLISLYFSRFVPLVMAEIRFNHSIGSDKNNGIRGNFRLSSRFNQYFQVAPCLHWS